jgi:protocatechuate 3,4-dioxygenase alpha subunit
LTVVPTPSQTAGPYVEIGAGWLADGHIVAEGTPGSLTVSGTVLDGAGDPVADAALEFWQADPSGRFTTDPSSAWSGFTRALSVDEGRYHITTVKPGRVPIDIERDLVEAPHLAVSVFARGLLQRLVTYVYFEDETDANAVDPLLSSLEADVRTRLMARSVPGGYRFDIVLQGEEETPFFVP